MLQLVRLVLDDGWQPTTAAERLRTHVADQRVLRQMAARVAGAAAERPSAIAERAATTIAAAMGRWEAGPARRRAAEPGGTRSDGEVTSPA